MLHDRVFLDSVCRRRRFFRALLRRSVFASERHHVGLHGHQITLTPVRKNRGRVAERAS